MSVLYLLTAAPPPIHGTDAVFQDVMMLSEAFQGETINLCPFKNSELRFPKQLYGFHCIADIRRLESRYRVNHVFFSLPYAFPVLGLLRNPVFYTITGSLDVKKTRGVNDRMRRLTRIIVSNERDAAVLQAWGMTNYVIIPPGIDVNITPSSLSLDRTLTLLMASAPWNRRQFESKGVDLLLAAAASLPFLRLILLWRGVLADELVRRVARSGIGDRVQIVNGKASIRQYLDKAHATILLARDGGVVKAFPHSLIESLLAGKPVLLSDTIAMSSYVTSRQCGVVVSAMNVDSLTFAIRSLMQNYAQLTRGATQIGRREFSANTMVENHRRAYGL